MEIIKELLKSGGLAILLALALPMFLVLPPEIGAGKGVHPAVVFLCVAIVAWGAACGWPS